MSRDCIVFGTVTAMWSGGEAKSIHCPSELHRLHCSLVVMTDGIDIAVATTLHHGGYFNALLGKEKLIFVRAALRTLDACALLKGYVSLFLPAWHALENGNEDRRGDG